MVAYANTVSGGTTFFDKNEEDWKCKMSENKRPDEKSVGMNSELETFEA